jgi:diguanylate cyclase (GGDEF)-like protein
MMPTRRHPIEFRDLLERVLPIDRLVPGERFRVQRALRSGVGRELESVALMAREQLGGASVRPPSAAASRQQELRYARPEPSTAVDLELPGPTERDGILLYPRAALPTRAPADLTQVRRLLHMEEVALLSDPRTSQARAALYDHLAQAGHELVGTGDLRLFPLPETEMESSGAPLAPGLATEALVRPSLLFYCPDLSRSRRLASFAEGGGPRALVLTAVLASDRTPVGLLEVRSVERAPFQPEDLARIALLADFCGTVLERAARLEKLVFVDSMTAVYNRAYFELQARNEVARAMREQASVALCIADIDDFKAVNTAYGYEAGNAVLIQVANALRRGVRPFDTVARWGGEEFAVLLTPPVQADDARAVCERLRQAVERLEIPVEGLDRKLYEVRVTLSVGVALFPEHANHPQDLWRAANQALLEAKRPPKNQVVFYRRGD